jgi:hypothetical protein
MPYFPTESESAYYCPNCKVWYTRARMSCLVNHPPGDCCHEYERRVDQPTPPQNARRGRLLASDKAGFTFGFTGFTSTE